MSDRNDRLSRLRQGARQVFQRVASPPDHFQLQSTDLTPPLDALRRRLIDDVLLLFALILSPGILISVSRALEIGWRPFMNGHLMALSLIWGLWLGRKRLSYLVKVWGGSPCCSSAPFRR